MSEASCRRMPVSSVGFEAGGLEVGRQADLEHVDLRVGRTERLRVRAAKGHPPGVEIVPDRGIGVAMPARVGRDSGNALEVGQRRHVHDRNARNVGLGDRIEELAHTGRAVLRLLHRQGHKVVLGRIDVARAAGGNLAGQLSGIDLDQPLAAFHRHANHNAFAVDQVGLGRETDELRRMARDEQLGREEGAIGRAQDQDVVSGLHGGPL